MSKALIPLGLIGVAGVMGSLAGGEANRGRRALPACATPGYNDDGVYGVTTYNGFAGIDEADRFAKEVREDKRHYVSGVYLANGKWSVDVKRYYHAPPAGRGRRAKTKKPKSIFVQGRRWMDTYGTTYHTADIIVDGYEVYTTPIASGYDAHYVKTAGDWLIEQGYLKKGKPRGMSKTPAWVLARAQGIDFDYEADDVRRKKDL